MGRLMRENYWIPFALSSQLVPGDGPRPVRLFGENYVAFRAEDGRIGFLDERRSGARDSAGSLIFITLRGAYVTIVGGPPVRERSIVRLSARRSGKGTRRACCSVARSPESGVSPMTTPNQRSRSLTTRNIFSS